MFAAFRNGYMDGSDVRASGMWNDVYDAMSACEPGDLPSAEREAWRDGFYAGWMGDAVPWM